MRMTLECAETLKNRIWLIPNLELGVDDGREFIERAEEAVVNPEVTQEFPDALDRIEFGTVRGKEEQNEARLLFDPPVPMEVGVMVFGVVDDDDNAVARAASDIPKPAKGRPN